MHANSASVEVAQPRLFTLGAVLAVSAYGIVLVVPLFMSILVVSLIPLGVLTALIPVLVVAATAYFTSEVIRQAVFSSCSHYF